MSQYYNALVRVRLVLSIVDALPVAENEELRAQIIALSQSNWRGKPKNSVIYIFE